ncbi:hypothetical protein V8C86DRAFT_3136429 [Haematococcus lacustris]
MSLLLPLVPPLPLPQQLIAFLEQYAEASGPFKWSRLGKFLFTNLLPGSSPALAKADFAVEEEGEEADEHVTASPRKAMSGPAQHPFGKVQPVFNTPTKDGAKPTECSQATAGLAQQPFRIVQPVFTTPTKDAAKPEECSQAPPQPSTPLASQPCSPADAQPITPPTPMPITPPTPMPAATPTPMPAATPTPMPATPPCLTEITPAASRSSSITPPALLQPTNGPKPLSPEATERKFAALSKQGLLNMLQHEDVILRADCSTLTWAQLALRLPLPVSELKQLGKLTTAAAIREQLAVKGIIPAPDDERPSWAALAQKVLRAKKLAAAVRRRPWRETDMSLDDLKLLLSDEGHGAEVERMAKKRDPLAEDADWRQLADNLTLALGCVAAEPV